MKKNLKKEVKSVKPFTFNQWLPLLLFIIAFLIYAQTISYDYAGDDSLYTTANSFVQKGISSIGGLVTKSSLYGNDGTNSVYYRPVFLIGFAIEKSIFGNSPAVNHFFNVLLYAILCVALFNFLRKLFKDYPPFVSALITILFIVHPLHTEVTANIKSSDELFCMLFGICSLNFILDYVQRGQNRFLIYSCVFFFLCLMSKENGFTYLPLIPLVLYFFTDSSLRKITLAAIPFIAITGLSIFIRWCALDSILFTNPLQIWQNSLVTATTLAEQTATAFTILLHALQLLFFPVTLSWDYSFNHFPVVGWSNYTAIVSLLIHVFLIVIACTGIKKKNIFSFAILFYFITSFLTSNLVIKIGTTFAERFLFAPSLGFCIVLPFLLSKIFKVNLKETSLQAARNVLIVSTLVIICFAGRTITRNNDWRNNFTILRSGIQTAPNSLWTHYTYATELLKRFNLETDAEQRQASAQLILNEYQRCIEIYPRFEIAYYERGVVYNAIGDTSNALKMYQEAVALKPDFLETLYNAGMIQFINKNYRAALTYFNKAIETNDKYLNAYVGAGACYRNLNDHKNAIANFEKALSLYPDNANLIRNLSEEYAMIGDTVKANYYNLKSR